MSRSTNIQQNSLRSGGSTSPGVGMRLIWQIVTGTVGEALKSGMVINVNPRRVPLSANSFTPYTQLRNLPKFSKGQVTGPIPFGPRVRGQICVNCVTTSAPHPLLFSSNINSHTRRKPGAVEVFRYSIYKRLSKGTAFAGIITTDGITNNWSVASYFTSKNTYRGIPSIMAICSFPARFHSHFTKAGAPVFSCGKVNSNYPILPHGVVGLCVRAHNRQSAIPFLQTNKKYYMFASISRLKNCGAAEPIAPCPVLNISIYTIAHLQATHIRAARKSTDYFLRTKLAVFEGHGGAAPHAAKPRVRKSKDYDIFRESSPLIGQRRGSSGPTTATDRDCPYTITTPTSNPRQNGPVLRRNRASTRRSNVRVCFFNQPLKCGLIDNASRTPFARPTGRRRVLRTNEASLKFKNLHTQAPARSFLKKTFCFISGTANHEPELSLTTKPSITARPGREHWECHSQTPGPNIPGDRRSSTIAALRYQTDHCQPIPRFLDARKREHPKKLSLA